MKKNNAVRTLSTFLEVVSVPMIPVITLNLRRSSPIKKNQQTEWCFTTPTAQHQAPLLKDFI